MTEKIIRFDDELHDLFANEMAEATGALKITFDMFHKCYPNAIKGPEARARRRMSSILRDLEGLRLAMEDLREAEKAKGRERS